MTVRYEHRRDGKWWAVIKHKDGKVREVTGFDLKAQAEAWVYYNERDEDKGNRIEASA